EGDVGCVVGAGEAAERGPDAERQQLGGDRVDPHRRGRDLILTNRHPGPSQARAVEVGDEDDGNCDKEADKYVESDGVGIEGEPRGGPATTPAAATPAARTYTHRWQRTPHTRGRADPRSPQPRLARSRAAPSSRRASREKRGLCRQSHRPSPRETGLRQ